MTNAIANTGLDELKKNLSDPWWRITSGKLYKILIKDNKDGDGLVIPFIPTMAQVEFLRNLHYRNIILKARQLGFTTAIAIYFLDCALFRDNIRAGVVAHTEDAAKKIFRDKYKFAYDNLPTSLRNAMPLKRDSADELMFAHNGSSIKVSTSMRSGTLQYLHVSEFGKICAEFPKRADEVITGSIPTVSNNGIVIIESTAEGRVGHFFNMVEVSKKNRYLPKLSSKQYKLFFYPWHSADEYRTDPDSVTLSAAENLYFDKIEVKLGVVIDAAQRAWWIATRDNDFGGEDSKMWQEYPSTEDEAFKKSTKGAYFVKQLTLARKEQRITKVPYQSGHVVNTVWDIGSGDGTAIWLIQRIGVQDYVIGFIEGWGEPYEYYVNELNELGYVFGNHYLPHDGAHVRQGEKTNITPVQMLKNLGLKNILVVPRIPEKIQAVNKLRQIFKNLWFDESACKDGLMHLDEYKEKWSDTLQCFTGQPDKTGGHSEAADALMQYAQMYDDINKSNRAPKLPKPIATSGWAG